MVYSERDRVLALAGIYQAAHCAQQIARRGQVDANAMEALIYSLFQTDPESTEAVFGEVSRVAPGARELVAQLAGKTTRNLELMRYAILLVQLERKLASNRPMLSQIADGIAAVKTRLEHFPMLHPNILAQLAEIYSATLSRLQPRIIVHGEPLHLQNPENVNRIRSLLLAGIRAARLWRQIGGSRWQILLGRKRLLAQAKSLSGTPIPGTDENRSHRS